jgi:hypothetical protein
MLGFSLILYGKYYTGFKFAKSPKMFLRKIFILDILDAFFLRMFVNIYFVKKIIMLGKKLRKKFSRNFVNAQPWPDLGYWLYGTNSIKKW